MKLWRKNRRVDRDLPSFVKPGLVRINQKLLQFASFLQHKTNNYSAGRKKVLLLVFASVFIVESTLIIIQTTRAGNASPITVTRIKTLPVEKLQRQTPPITKSAFVRIQKFKNYIDSLGATTKGRKQRDSLLGGRPRLMDSVNFLINLYLEQLKSK